MQSSEAVRDVIPTVFHEYTYNLDYMIISDSYMMKPSARETYIKVTLNDSIVTFPVSEGEVVDAIPNRLLVLISDESMYGEKFKCKVG